MKGRAVGPLHPAAARPPLKTRSSIADRPAARACVRGPSDESARAEAASRSGAAAWGFTPPMPRDPGWARRWGALGMRAARRVHARLCGGDTVPAAQTPPFMPAAGRSRAPRYTHPYG